VRFLAREIKQLAGIQNAGFTIDDNADLSFQALQRDLSLHSMRGNLLAGRNHQSDDL
jgi:hypothetical protein